MHFYNQQIGKHFVEWNIDRKRQTDREARERLRVTERREREEQKETHTETEIYRQADGQTHTSRLKSLKLIEKSL